MEQRKLSAKEILADIKIGMSDAELMEKYQLRDSQLQKVFEKLSAGGLLNNNEILNRGKIETQTSTQTLFNCPACGKPQTKQQEECPDCGLIFNKFKDRQVINEPPKIPISDQPEEATGQQPIAQNKKLTSATVLFEKLRKALWPYRLYLSVAAAVIVVVVALMVFLGNGLPRNIETTLLAVIRTHPIWFDDVYENHNKVGAIFTKNRKPVIVKVREGNIPPDIANTTNPTKVYCIALKGRVERGFTSKDIYVNPDLPEDQIYKRVQWEASDVSFEDAEGYSNVIVWVLQSGKLKIDGFSDIDFPPDKRRCPKDWDNVCPFKCGDF